MWLSIHTLRISVMLEKNHDEAEDDTCKDNKRLGRVLCAYQNCYLHMSLYTKGCLITQKLKWVEE